MALIGIQGFPVAHGKNNEGGGGVTIINGGSANIPSDLNLNSITASQGSIRSLSGIDLEYNDALFKYASAEDAQINKLRGNEINYAKGRIADIQSDTTKTGSLTADEMSSIKGYVKSLLSDNITTEYLNVTKQAHFFELIIDKIRAVGGTLLMTQAQAVADYVKALKVVNGQDVEVPIDSNEAEYYDIFFLAQKNDGDNNTREISNDWIEGDQAYCQSFNNVAPNVPNYNVTNKYYWRLVTAKLDDRYMNLDTGEEVTSEDIEEAELNDKPNPAEWNKVTINSPSIMYTDSGSHTTILRNCRVEAQSSGEVIWDLTHAYEDQTGERYVAGDLYTQNTDEGIEIVFSDIAIPEQAHFSVGCSSARLNITVYYLDGGSEFFPASTNRQTSHGGTLTNGSGVEKIIITNADTVQLKLVHGIRLSNKTGECDKSFPVPTSDVRYINTASIPSKGDNLAQLGYRWTQDDTNEKSRGNAIIIAAYKSPDAGCQSSAIGEHLDPIVPPSYAQYEAIGSDSNHYFDLAYYRKTYMDGTGSKFYGKFYAMAGGQPQEIGATYLHVAYANSADGQTDFTKTPAANTSYLYMGICTNTNQSDAGLVYTDYTWSKISSTINYKLVDQGSKIYTNVVKETTQGQQGPQATQWYKQLYCDLKYKILRIEGTNTRYLTVGEARNFPKLFERYSEGTAYSRRYNSINYDGIFPYIRIQSRALNGQGSYDTASIKYYRFHISNDYHGTHDGEVIHTNDDAEAEFTWSPAPENAPEKWAYNANDLTTPPIGSGVHYITISGNDDISVKLYAFNISSTTWIPDTTYPYYAIYLKDTDYTTSEDTSIWSYAQDDISLSIITQPTSTISVLEDQINLRSSTTDSISELTVGVIGIQGTVYGTQGPQGTQGLVEQVSYLNQQSDSISLAVQKVYGSVGIKNEFGFNTGARSYDSDDYRTCLMWPYGYGIIGWGRINRVCQLNIRESVDETWTISCYMKANAATTVNVNFCDINAVRIYKNGEQIALPSGNWVSVGTSYDKWEFVFEHVNDVNHGGSTTIGAAWGGFFDFEQQSNSINTIHVKNIVLTRGEKPNCEFAMAEEDLTYAGSGQDFTWNKGTVTLESDTFRGYPVYRNTSYPSEGNYLDFFTYDTYTIKDHMPYTLSFWAKSSVMNTYIESFMYNNDIHSIPSGVVVDDNFGVDGKWRTYLSTDWQYYTVKWVPDLKTTQWPTDYVKKIITCRISYSSNSQHSGYVYLAGVTLQEGWTEGMGGTTSSLIKQTADEISLSVTSGLQSTGIDIESGRITLDGENVDVVGNLNVTGTQSSFQFVDDNGNVRLNIGNTSMPNKDRFLGGNIQKWFQGVYATQTQLQGYTDYISIGQWNSGTGAIVITGGSRSYMLMKTNTGGGQFDGASMGMTVGLTPSLYYYNGSSYVLISTGATSITNITSTGDFQSTIGGGTFDATQSNNTEYFIRYAWYVSGSNIDWSRPNTRYEIHYYFTYTPNNIKKHVYFSNDGFGILYNNNTNSYFYTGSQETEIKYYGNEAQLLINYGGTHIRRYTEHITSNNDKQITKLGDYYLETVISGVNIKLHQGHIYYDPLPGDYIRIYNLTNTRQSYWGYGTYSDAESNKYYYKIVTGDGLTTLPTYTTQQTEIYLFPWTRTDFIWDGSCWMVFRYNIRQS